MGTNKLYQSLTAWGCDIQNARDRFLEDDDLYVIYLEAFLEDENFALLQSNLKSGNGEEAFDNAHTLKGVAGNLGIQPMYDSISAIVECLRLGNMNRNLLSLYRALEEQKQYLNKMLETSGALLNKR